MVKSSSDMASKRARRAACSSGDIVIFLGTAILLSFPAALGQLVDGFQHGVYADMDVFFSGREFGVAHDLLNDAGGNILQGQGGGGCVAAGIGGQAACPGPGQGGVKRIVEIVFVDTDKFFTGGMGAEVLQDGK